MSAAEFCVLTRARCGSNLLCSILNSHPAILCHYEVFHRTRVYSEFADFNGLLPWLRRIHDPLKFWADLRMASESRRPDAQVIGFKLFVEHDPRVFRHVTRSKATKVIVLERRNRLAQYSSLLIARKTNQYVARTAGPRRMPLVTFDPGGFDRFCKATDRAFALARRSLEHKPLSVIELGYEDLSDRNAIQSVFDWLGVSPYRGASTGLSKQNSDDLLSRFQNPQAVLSALGERGQLAWLEPRDVSTHTVEVIGMRESA